MTGPYVACRASAMSICAVCAVMLIAVRPVQAQAFEIVGVRALGMGGAFVAVADDATANYWNPAGLADVFFSAVLDVQRTETRIGADQSFLEGTRDGTTFASMGSPSMGLSYYRSRSFQLDRAGGVGPVSLSALVTQHAGLTLVQPFLPGVTLADVTITKGRASAHHGERQHGFHAH